MEEIDMDYKQQTAAQKFWKTQLFNNYERRANYASLWTKLTCDQWPAYCTVYRVKNTIYLKTFEGSKWCHSKDSIFYLSGSKWFPETHGKSKILWSVNSWYVSAWKRQNNRWNWCDNNERLYAGIWLASLAVPTVVKPPAVTTSPQRPVFQKTKSLQGKSLCLEPLEILTSYHLSYRS